MGARAEAVLWVLHALNIAAVLVVPSVTIHKTQAEPIPAFFIMLITIVLWMKLVSFWHCNRTLRCCSLLGPAGPNAYLIRAPLLSLWEQMAYA